MRRQAQSNRYPGMRTSPWIILGSTVILLIVVIVLAMQNTNREQRYMTKVLREKGAALIRAVEAGARTGMMGMLWGEQQIQRLLEETARFPDILYMVLLDPDGIAVAHSDPSKIGIPFRPDHKVVHLGPELEENWALVSSGNGGQVFEVHRRFEPLKPGREHRFGRMRGMMHWHGEMYYAVSNRSSIKVRPSWKRRWSAPLPATASFRSAPVQPVLSTKSANSLDKFSY